MSTNNASAAISPWPHRMAVVLACATFPLIWIGGLVTTTKAGMAAPDWPNTFGYNLFLYPWTTWFAGPWDLFVEHGHRLFAAGVGLLTIILVVVCWRREPRGWVRWFAGLLLAAVIGQGVLGGMRVLFNEQTFAMIHGCTGPAFFALTVAMACVTSSHWRTLPCPSDNRDGGRVRALAVATTTLVYVQLILGAQLRHVSPEAPPSAFRAFVWAHLIAAGVVVWHVAWLWLRVRRLGPQGSWLKPPTRTLLALMVAQPLLGGLTWLGKHGWPTWLPPRAWAETRLVTTEGLGVTTLVTAHVAIGSLMLVVALLVALRSCRSFRAAGGVPAWNRIALGVAC